MGVGNTCIKDDPWTQLLLSPTTPRYYRGTINIGGDDLKKGKKFKYLGSITCNDRNTIPDARAHANAVWNVRRQVNLPLLLQLERQALQDYMVI
uniref:Uncharacterized protein n=1 Tax=Romanomermis culicivorax TaxID=13658 RepID=A0A915IPW0_ROMCU